MNIFGQILAIFCFFSKNLGNNVPFLSGNSPNYDILAIWPKHVWRLGLLEIVKVSLVWNMRISWSDRYLILCTFCLKIDHTMQYLSKHRVLWAKSSPQLVTKAIKAIRWCQPLIQMSRPLVLVFEIRSIFYYYYYKRRLTGKFHIF